MVDIIAVDDEDNITGFLKVFFRIKGWDARIFNNAHDALAFLKNEKTSVVMTDINMPQMNGIEFARKARTICPEIPIVAFTGSVDEFSLQPEDFDSIIEKPASIEELAKSLEKYFKKKKNRRDTDEHLAIKI